MREIKTSNNNDKVSNHTRTLRLHTHVMMAVIIIWFWAGCTSLDDTTPPRFPILPTPKPGPTITAKPTPEPVPPVTVGLFVDSANTLLEDIKIISGDGMAILYLEKGTKVVEPRQIESITIVAEHPGADPQGISLIGLTYTFNPIKANLDSPALVSIRYDPSLVPDNVDKTLPQIAYFDEIKSTWTFIDGNIDHEIHTVTSEVNHLGTYIIAFKILSLQPIS